MAVLNHLFRIPVFYLFLSLVVRISSANDILGCGGFVKSHVSLDFSKIEIGLYTKAGSLKERTECAPTNGYYFLPLYEKGEYVLKVHPPPGWSFEPSQVELHVDGSTDHCSTGQDINFAFNGFGITGKVITAGQTKGPSGIAVQLINDLGETRNTVTSAGGDFHFTPVIPGKYTLKASHPKWKLDPSQAIVQVKEGNTALPVGVLAVKGYDVKGSVTSYGTPIRGVYVLLYSKEESPKYRVEGCNTALLQGVPDAPICHSVTDSAGEFSFGLVPAGEYKLLALAKNPGQASISYNIKPESVPFSVAHDSQYIKSAFEVTGFTIVGTVLTTTGGKGMPGVRVLKDGQPVGKTDAAGKFTLPSLHPGTYVLSFQHDQSEFNDVHFTLSPSGPITAPTAAVARWKVCGSVTPADERGVTITPEKGGNSVTVRVTPENDGKWCTYLPSGVYSAKVQVSESEQREGLQFYPVTQKVSVGHAPVGGVTFSQLKARLHGRVQCKAAVDCEGLSVTLQPLSPDGGYIGQPLTAPVVNGEYVFEEVVPGSVEVSVGGSARLCWADARRTAALTQADAELPPFLHTGYGLRLQLSHPAEVEFSSKGSRGVLSAPRGPSQHCVETAELYTLTPRSCHRFNPLQATVDTASKKLTTVTFVAVSHAVVVKVLSPEPVKDLVLKVTTDGRNARTVGPLVPLDQPAGGYAFEHTLYMAEGEVAVISAESSSLLFLPSDPQQVLGRGECQPAALTVRAVRGLTLAGRLVPPVSDVLITVTADDTKLTQITTEDGTYSFGPLDASVQYAVTAEKESYVFSPPDAQGNMAAHKLAEITVTLLDDGDNAPLQGALVSVSGGTYRRNVASGADGKLRFASLSPGEYYVKPNMKEYKFDPPHKIVKVDEGKTHHITLKGVRVAWSCVGAVVSLGGVGWPGVSVAAMPTAGNARCTLEEATTELNGSFRIRGLLPQCVYNLQLKEPSVPELNGLKLAGKEPPQIVVKEKKDIENVRLIAIQPTQVTDVSVLVYAADLEHYKSLRVYLALDDSPNTPIYSTKMDPAGYTQQLNPGLMYVLPRLPADNKTYVLSLSSTVSKTMYSYEEQVHYFVSDGRYKHFTFEFIPTVKTSEQELRQTSFLVIPLVIALIIAYFNRDTVLDQATNALQTILKNQPKQSRATRPDVLDKASIDHIVSTVNAAGKKQGKKKVQ